MVVTQVAEGKTSLHSAKDLLAVTRTGLFS